MKNFIWLKCHNIKVGVRNIINWFPIIWKDRWWDHDFLYRILRFKLIQMEEKFRTEGHSVNSAKDAKDIKKCIITLDRLIGDNYFDMVEKRIFRKGNWKYASMLREQDLDFLFTTMRKHVESWWD